ncbi:hypothetical protein [Candidatus Nitrospira bockiana]
MPLIWCAISGHGFGHAAQVVPVLNELADRIPGATAILRTTTPASFFRGRLRLPWELLPGEQDVGCVQQGPLHIDVAATWAAHRVFHETWAQRLEQECEALRSRAAAMVLADIPYLALEAARHCGIPAVGLSSISWDQVLVRLQTPGDDEQEQLVQAIRRSYGHAAMMIRLAPGIAMPAFPRLVDVGPILGEVHVDKAGLHRAVGATSGERIVVVGFGGIELTTLPWPALDAMKGYRFVVPGRVPGSLTRVHSADPLPFAFRTIMASADVLMTKPGYATVIEAVAAAVPTVYVRRYNFVDEDALVDYLHAYGRAVELSSQHFAAGRWAASIEAALLAAPPQLQAPKPTGAAEAAEVIVQALRRTG